MKFKSDNSIFWWFFSFIFNKKFIEVELWENNVSLKWKNIKKNIEWEDIKSIKLNKFSSPVNYSMRIEWDKNNYTFMFSNSVGISMPRNFWVVWSDISSVWEFIEKKKIKYNI
jgi:hypothetical protein